MSVNADQDRVVEQCRGLTGIDSRCLTNIVYSSAGVRTVGVEIKPKNQSNQMFQFQAV